MEEDSERVYCRYVFIFELICYLYIYLSAIHLCIHSFEKIDEDSERTFTVAM